MRIPLRVVAATLGLAATALAVGTLRNARSLPVAQPSSGADTSPGPDTTISVLLPARNESGNIERCLPTLLSLHGATEILVLDDQSTDDTAAIAKRLVEADPRAAVLQDNGTSIPPGWLGKSWACERLAQAAKGDVLAFVDADVTLNPSALVSAVRLMRELNVDMICPYPEQLTSTPLTRLVQPLLQWSWLTFIPVTTSMDRQLPSMAVGNGQFAVFSAPAYRSVGGHAAVAGDVLEDVGLARAMRRAGYRTAVVDGSAIAKCRMYETDSELVDGYTKSLWAATGSELGALGIAGLLKLLYVLPPLFAATSRDRNVRAWGAVGYAAGVASRVVVARKTGQRVWPEALTQPLSVTAFSALTVISIWRHRRGELQWKGRPLP